MDTKEPEIRAPGYGRNDPCFCGSGKKFKRCHGRQLMEKQARAFSVARAEFDGTPKQKVRCVFTVSAASK